MVFRISAGLSPNMAFFCALSHNIHDCLLQALLIYFNAVPNYHKKELKL